mgnify:CR=1 FL=1
MKRPVLQPLLAWAIRDLMRRPLESGLLVTALLLTVSVTAAPLLFTQALSTTTNLMLRDAPSLIVRKFNALGWTPIPSDQSAQLAKSVPGVIVARPRVWGRVAGPEGPLTVIGVDRGGPPLPQSTAVPGRGEAVAGTDVKGDRAAPFLTLTGQRTARLRVVGRSDGLADRGQDSPGMGFLRVADPGREDRVDPRAGMQSLKIERHGLCGRARQVDGAQPRTDRRRCAKDGARIRLDSPVGFFPTTGVVGEPAERPTSCASGTTTSIAALTKWQAPTDAPYAGSGSPRSWVFTIRRFGAESSTSATAED